MSPVKPSLIILITFLIQANCGICQVRQDHVSPIDYAELIGNKLIRETPFQYKYALNVDNQTFNGMQFVNFGRTFRINQAAVAYAYSNIDCPDDMEMEISIDHTDGCKLWLNSQLVYEKRGDKDLRLSVEERNIELSGKLKLSLRKGNNNILIKSETRGNEWIVLFQPPSDKGAVVKDQLSYPEIGLKKLAYIDSKIADITNWLVVGPFENPVSNDIRMGLDIVYGPEKSWNIGQTYKGIDGPVSWTIPKIEVTGELFDPKPWGTNYNWNYHNGGVAWAMQKLSEVTGESKYNDYANRFCDFHLNSIPFIEYQVNELYQFNCINRPIINTPLLDFTLAPSLPLIYRLRREPVFSNRDAYSKFIEKMLEYASKGQLRLPGEGIYTRLTPEIYTTWVDDMFMGIPFLVQASQMGSDEKVKEEFLNDAAAQVIGFQKQVWDPEAHLYMHAKYLNREVKLPHWSRANGWGIWATTEVLMVLPKNHPQYKSILSRYREHVDALIKLQDADGFWHNVLDRPDSKQEVSGTAIFTMAIARGILNGWLNASKYKPFAIKGWEAIKTQIDADGTVHNICMGTMCSEDVNYYMTRPFYDNDTHGLFAVLYAAIEMELLNKTITRK